MSLIFSEIQKGWWSFELPGYRPGKSTYDLFSFDDLPSIDQSIRADFLWLYKQTDKNNSLSDGVYSNGEKPDLSKIIELQKIQKLLLPSEFVQFIQQTGLHTKVRTCTDCFLELPDFIVKTEGVEDGFLVHFLSDSQYCLHWFLYLNLSGANCVLASEKHYGINMDNSPATIDIASEPLWFCAPSFNQFIYRFWLENEIWFTLVDKDRSLTETEKVYLNHYAK